MLKDGKILAAAQEERFTRKKHDAGFPAEAIKYVLGHAGRNLEDLSAIVFYDKPYLKFERLLETYHAYAPQGLKSFLMSMPIWVKEKLFMKSELWKGLEKINGKKFSKRPPLLFPEHHLSHGASAFYPSPFEEAAVLTIDGVGEWATTTIAKGSKNQFQILRESPFPHSLGLLYSAFTYYCGFKVNSGEYKLMGLAPYGNPNSNRVDTYIKTIKEKLIRIHPDGSLLLNMEYFDFATGLTMCVDKKWEKLFELKRRQSESPLGQEYMDLALAIQNITEEVVVLLAKNAKKLTGSPNLVMAGGVALNCVANGKLKDLNIFDNIWIQPAAGDAGGALGAALAAYYIYQENPRNVNSSSLDAMEGSYLGPDYSDINVRTVQNKYQAPAQYFENFAELAKSAAKLIAEGHVIGWHQGRMEWGPRALGNRSILADPRNPEMQKKLNLKIKYREGFRPFAPSVLYEDVSEWFQLNGPSPYMLLVNQVQPDKQNALPADYWDLPMFDRLYFLRSNMPSITHVDFSARIQTVHKETNARYYQLIQAFKEITNVGMLVNTSFNVRGEPIVCTPEDAYRCFMRTEMDYLVVGNFLFDKKNQPAFADTQNWQDTFELD